MIAENFLHFCVKTVYLTNEASIFVESGYFTSCGGLKVMCFFLWFYNLFLIFSSFTVMCLHVNFFVFILLWDCRVLKSVSWFLLTVLENSQPSALPTLLSFPSRILITYIRSFLLFVSYTLLCTFKYFLHLFFFQLVIQFPNSLFSQVLPSVKTHLLSIIFICRYF